MKTIGVFLALLVLVVGPAGAMENHGSVGAGHGVILPSGDTNPCSPPGALQMNFDGSAENGYCWQYGGIVPPYYGAFAECYDVGTDGICGIELLLTGIGYPCQPADLYVWADAGGIPGNVLCTTTGVNPCPVATWPNISTHDFAITCSATGSLFVGYWCGAYANQPCGYFVAADTNGFGGCPMTNVAPGIGFPTGWNNVSVAWGPTQSIGIGAWEGGGIVPVRDSSWGRVKQAYK